MPTNRDSITMAYRIRRLPRRYKKQTVYKKMLKAVETGRGDLPKGWEIDWYWRNAPEKPLLSDTFENVVKKSRIGFLFLMAMRLRRDMTAAGFHVPKARKIRKATKAEAAAVVGESDELSERRAEKEAKRKRRARKSAKKTAKRRRRGK